MAHRRIKIGRGARASQPLNADSVLGGYRVADLDRALLKSQRSDRVGVSLRALQILLVYALLARAVAAGLPAQGLLLPLLIELLAMFWLGSILAGSLVPCAAFRASAGGLGGRLLCSALIAACVLGLLWSVPALAPGGRFEPAQVPAWLHQHGLHWAVLGTVAGLSLHSLREVLDWRARGGPQAGVFVWSSIQFIAARIAVVICVGLFLGLPAFLLAPQLLPGLAKLSSESHAWILWGVLLALELATLAVLSLMHHDLSKPAPMRPASPASITPEPSP